MKTLSLELSKELTELCKSKGIAMPDSYFNFLIEGESEDASFPEYSLDELLDWLPEKSNYNSNEDIGIMTVSTRGKRFKEKGITWFCGYYVEKSTPEQSYWSYCTFDNEPVNAAGQLLINLIKEGYLK